MNALDLSIVRARQGTTAGSLGPGPAVFYIRTMDLNGDGRINALDLTAVRRNLNQSLPAAATSVLVDSH